MFELPIVSYQSSLRMRLAQTPPQGTVLSPVVRDPGPRPAAEARASGGAIKKTRTARSCTYAVNPRVQYVSRVMCAMFSISRW